ncbi:hypothetical protein NDU88_003462 [Pleurodeles waltl]|uniref:Programmed cell death protein 2 C-terminal domain-containing protein n=2 Tax=Pleurodeles waltl TaxID=8319 RepID=A0AAV7KWK8_PLEWA|nr:hypothetical protein NDU88_003462 [Pleurodeles waltl]
MTSSSACPPVNQPVLLGLRDAAIGGHETCSFDTNKIGGLPECSPQLTMLYPVCGVCSYPLIHLVQIYCPLEGSPFHRVFNVFACGRVGCRGNTERWKILRSQHLDTQVGKKQECSDQQREITSAKDWCEEADDWGLNEEAEAQGDMSQHLLTTSASKVSTSTAEAECTDNFHNLSLSEPGQGLVLPLSYIVLPSHHISVMDEEDYTGCIDVHHAQKLLKEYQQREGVDVEQLLSESFSAKGEQEKYEKSEMKTRDLLFHQFKKRISVCQEQILRYSWKGQPLFITSPPSTFPDVVPRCCVCGSDRDFEFQLMPALISILTHLDNSLSLEFGTVLVYTCEKSCWPSGQSSPLEEFPFIQEDPDERYFR